LIKIGLREILNVAGDGDPGVVDQNADRPEFRFYTLNHLGDRAGLRDVRGNRHRTSAGLADGIDECIRVASALAIIDGDSGAGLSKRSDDRCSNATGASGHQCGPAMQGACCHEHLRLLL
jgi:hypothetical protein